MGTEGTRKVLLGQGSYSYNSAVEAQYCGWRYLLGLIERKAPAVLQSLADDVLPLYTRQGDPLAVCEIEDDGWRCVDFLPLDALEELLVNETLMVAIELWATKHGLTNKGKLAEPLLRIAVLTLDWWLSCEAARGKRLAQVIGAWEKERVLTCDEEIEISRVRQTTAAIREALRKQRGELRDAEKQIATLGTEGLQRTKLKSQEHFAWFVRRRVLGESIRSIAGEHELPHIQEGWEIRIRAAIRQLIEVLWM